MGVPGLWSFIEGNFKFAIVQHADMRYSKKYVFDYVYLDANGMLHMATQKIFNYGDNKRVRDPYLLNSFEEKMFLSFELFFEKILDVLRVVEPSKLLYIAIDGTAPRAKQNQQRERRFQNSKESSKVSIVYNEDLGECVKEDDGEIPSGGQTSKPASFNTSRITPGTDFMHQLSKYMYYRIRREMNTSATHFWRRIRVIFSPPTFPGEGEHILMDYIRVLDPEEKRNATHCIFGPDGDLLNLGLSTHLNKIFVFREDIRTDKYLGFAHLVDMGKIRRKLATSMGIDRKKGFHPNSISDNFVCFGFLVGNDFLPSLKMLRDVKQSLERMIDLYYRISTGKTSNTIKQLVFKDKFNFNVWADFLRDISIEEENELILQLKLETDGKYPCEELLRDLTLRKFCDIDPDSGEYTLDYLSFREEYYRRAGIPKESLIDGVNRMCKDYVKTMVWTYYYYTFGLPSWSYSYRWHYAPLAKDLYRYLTTLTDEKVIKEDIYSFDKSRPALPFEQLLGVLPSSSSNLLPEEYGELMTSPDSELVKMNYFPTEYIVDYEGKKRAHMASVILPFVDFGLVSEAYEYVAERSPWKYHRNELGPNSEFVYDESLSGIDFVSEYGEIKNCKIRRKDVDV